MTPPLNTTLRAAPSPAGARSVLSSLLRLAQRMIGHVERLQPLAQLAARLYVGKVFFQSGWVSLQDWSGTLSLYEDDFHVPLLPPHLAAYLGTAGEIVLPVLLVLGLAGRFGAAGLLVVNVVAYLSVPDLSAAAAQQHVFWGSLLVALTLWGPGALSADHVIVKALGLRR
jgi:putative oxidoreductase